MRELETEVLVIGSGYGAVAPGLRLTEAGHAVLMIEKGRDIEPQRDFRMTQDPKYLQTFLKDASSNEISLTYAEGLGGGSGFSEMVSLRAPRKTFEQTDARGRRYWPAKLDRAALDPYYTRAEHLLRVRQIEPHRIPKSGIAFSQLLKNLGYSCDRARYAIDVDECVGCSYCVSGCVWGAKQSLHRNYLRRARAAGLRVMTEIDAREIRPLSNGDYRYEVRCGDGAHTRIAARNVVLAGGTIGTARLLLESVARLPRLGPHVGRNIAFNGSVKAGGILCGDLVDGDMVTGMSHPGMISYEFWNERSITVSCAKPSPLGLVATARISLHGDTRQPRGWGAAHVELMKNYRRRMLVMYALGLTPPAAELVLTAPGRVEPRLKIDDALARYHAETLGLLNSLFERNGCRHLDATMTDFDGREYSAIRFDTAHMVGSARMADDPADGVVDASGECFGHPGLFVSDGAAIPTSLGVNPSLTILANAERIADRMVRRLGHEKTTR